MGWTADARLAETALNSGGRNAWEHSIETGIWVCSWQQLADSHFSHYSWSCLTGPENTKSNCRLKIEVISGPRTPSPEVEAVEQDGAIGYFVSRQGSWLVHDRSSTTSRRHSTMEPWNHGTSRQYPTSTSDISAPADGLNIRPSTSIELRLGPIKQDLQCQDCG